MNSTQLIDAFRREEERLGSKATSWNMFCEGYCLGINDEDVKESHRKEVVDRVSDLIDEMYVGGLIHASNIVRVKDIICGVIDSTLWILATKSQEANTTNS